MASTNTEPARGGAAVIAIGDELLTSGRADLNGPWLGERLEAAGLALERVEVLGDDEARVANAIEAALLRHRLVVTTGGLGPTLDDVTRQAAARALGAELVHDEASWQRIVGFFAERGRTAPEGNQRQALFPRGATVLANERGTAPGFCARAQNGSFLFVLPGPPGEMRPMASAHLLPFVTAELVRREERPFAASAMLFGIGESDFADRAGAWLERDADPRMGVCAHGGVLEIKATAFGAGGADRARARIDELAARFADHFVAPEYSSLQAVLVRELGAAGATLATAESCTGGGVAAALTDVPGSSAVFEWGAVTYANRAKTAALGVPEDLLARVGAVSGEVAAAMATGARRASGCDWAVSTTGIAGPDGGSDEKPVGLVWFGLAGPDGRVHTLRRLFPRLADRARIRRYATQAALGLALWGLRGRAEALGAERVDGAGG